MLDLLLSTNSKCLQIVPLHKELQEDTLKLLEERRFGELEIKEMMPYFQLKEQMMMISHAPLDIST